MTRVLGVVLKPIEALSVEGLRQLRTCSRELKEEVQSVRIDTLSTRLLEASLHSYRCAMICPSPRDGEDGWTNQWMKCASPFCHEFTGPWVPSQHDGLPFPCADSVYGSHPVSCWMVEYPNYRYVVCSSKCYHDVRHLLRLRRKDDNAHKVLIGVWNRHEPHKSLHEICPFCGDLRGDSRLTRSAGRTNMTSFRSSGRCSVDLYPFPRISLASDP